MKKFIIFVLLVSLVGCAHIGTVKFQLNDQAFQAENLPFRTLSVAVISKESWAREDIETLINNVSDLMAAQVGIRLRIDKWISHPVPSFTPTEGVRNVAEVIGKEHEHYDLVVGFSSHSVISHLIELTTGFVWLGAIDDSYRKFIIIKYLDERILMHEICHAFVFKKSHSISGVLTAAMIKIPLVPALFNSPKYVSKGDRMEILRNKWRDFNEKPAISEELQINTVGPPTHQSANW
jgi:hypothetical protein